MLHSKIICIYCSPKFSFVLLSPPIQAIDAKLTGIFKRFHK